MTQTYQKTIELEIIEDEDQDAEVIKTVEVDEKLGDLNPRYFEEVESLDEGKQRAYTTDINVGSKFNFFSVF